MKKVLTLCLFAFALLLSTQTATAQEKAEINKIAAERAQELRSQLKFNDNALEQVYLAYQEYENKLSSVKKHMTEGTTDQKQAVAAVNKRLNNNIKNAIGAELYNRYLILTDQHETEATDHDTQPQLQGRSSAKVKKSR